MQRVPSIMNHSLFTLSNTLISGLLARLLGHWAQDFRFIRLQTWNRVALLTPRLRESRFTKFVFFQYTALQWSKHFVVPILVQCLCHLGATTQYARYSFLITGTYSTVSFFSALLQLLFPVLFGINQLLSYRITDVSIDKTMSGMFFQLLNMWYDIGAISRSTFPVLVYIFSHPRLFHDFGPPLPLGGFS